MNARDTLHGWAVAVLGAMGEPPVTCEAVLCEACWQLRSSPATVARVLEMPARGDVTIRAVVADSGAALAAKVRKYAPEMDMVDACVARLAEIFPRARIITTDERNFTVYRSDSGRPLHLITPHRLWVSLPLPGLVARLSRHVARQARNPRSGQTVPPPPRTSPRGEWHSSFCCFPRELPASSSAASAPPAGQTQPENISSRREGRRDRAGEHANALSFYHCEIPAAHRPLPS